MLCNTDRKVETEKKKKVKVACHNRMKSILRKKKGKFNMKQQKAIQTKEEG